LREGPVFVLIAAVVGQTVTSWFYEHWAIWSHVTAMVRDGRQNAFLREYGKMAFAHARANPGGYGAIFGRAMSGFSVIQSAWALDALRNYDLSSAATWCDVAGGHGHMMCWGSGRERTEEEYASLLQASGWRFVASHYPSHGRMGIIEGVAV
jgi:hypothetical protein